MLKDGPASPAAHAAAGASHAAARPDCARSNCGQRPGRGSGTAAAANVRDAAPEAQRALYRAQAQQALLLLVPEAAAAAAPAASAQPAPPLLAVLGRARDAEQAGLDGRRADEIGLGEARRSDLAPPAASCRPPSARRRGRDV